MYIATCYNVSMDKSQKIEKIALYARVSTLLGQDPENQLIHLRQMAQGRGFEIVGEFVDKGISGAKERRPALDEMMKQARLGRFQHVGVTALDRLGRSTKHMLLMMEEFRHLNISMISIREGIEMSSPIGQLIMTVISSIAQLERSLISERIKNALAAKKMAAAATGSGWRCGRVPVVSPDIEKQILDLRREAQSIRQIAKRLGIGKSTVQRVLKELSHEPTKNSTSASEVKVDSDADKKGVPKTSD